jgi:acyl carrier protein
MNAELSASQQGLIGVVCARWSSLLDHDVTPDDDIFDLGADSLTAVEFAIALEEEEGIEIDLALLFNHPTARQLVGAISSADMRT